MVLQIKILVGPKVQTAFSRVMTRDDYTEPQRLNSIAWRCGVLLAPPLKASKFEVQTDQLARYRLDNSNLRKSKIRNTLAHTIF